MHRDVKKILISEEQIIDATKKLAKEISEDYKGKKPILLGLLKGCVPFIGDLCKRLTIDVEIEYMDVSSYEGTESTGKINIIKDIETSVEGRDIIIAEDIIDTGRTLKHTIDLLLERGANSVKIVTMLDKPEGRLIEIEADYIGFVIPKEFVIGYGLDFNELYRNLPYVGVLKEEVYLK